MKIYIQTMFDDDDKDVVAQACTSTVVVINDCSYVALEYCKITIKIGFYIEGSSMFFPDNLLNLLIVSLCFRYS